LRRPAERPPLTHCPICKKPVRKVISGVNTPKVSEPLSASDDKRGGVLRLGKARKRRLREIVDLEAGDCRIDVDIYDFGHVRRVASRKDPGDRYSI
jgi:hypothetical protein